MSCANARRTDAIERQRLERPEISKNRDSSQLEAPVRSIAEKYSAGKTFGRAEGVKRGGRVTNIEVLPPGAFDGTPPTIDVLNVGRGQVAQHKDVGSAGRGLGMSLRKDAHDSRQAARPTTARAPGLGRRC